MAAFLTFFLNTTLYALMMKYAAVPADAKTFFLTFGAFSLSCLAVCWSTGKLEEIRRKADRPESAKVARRMLFVFFCPVMLAMTTLFGAFVVAIGVTPMNLLLHLFSWVAILLTTLTALFA